MEKYRKGFESGKVLSTEEDWEDDIDYWLYKTPEERIEGVTNLIQIHIEMYGLPDRVDKSTGESRVPFEL